jgi:general secretion pathway protein A
MYERYYELNQKPFDVTPNPRSLYLSKSHKEALAALIYGVTERRGFIALIGEVGTGKTTLINAALERLSDNIRTAYIFNTDVSFNEILNMVLVEFGLSDGEELLSKVTALNRLNKYATKQFSKGINLVLIIDEAQNLDSHTMENLRLLSNLETSRYKLVQIVLSGQPELDEILRNQQLRQLAQRINLRRYLLPLSEPETYEYIQQHLKEAGREDRKLFDKGALRMIWRYSGGVPRKINMLCDNALLIGYGLEKKRISEHVVREAIRDFDESPYDENTVAFEEMEPSRPERKRRLGAPRPALAAGFALLMIFLVIGGMAFLPSQTRMEMSAAVTNYLSDLIHDDAAEGPSAPESPETSDSRAAASGGETSEKPMPVEIVESPEASASIEAAPDNTEPEVPALRNEEERITASPETVESSREATRSADEIAASPETLESSNGPTRNAQEITAPPEILESPNMANQNADGIATSPESLTSSNAAAQNADETIKHFRVREGDTLFGILEHHYGSYERMLPLVLQLNPQILDPDWIMPGDAIRLPSEVP